MKCTIVLLVILFGCQALADKNAAREAYQRGVKQYNLGEYQASLEAFTAAYNEVADPTLLFNLAQCHRQLGASQKAVTLYKSYLREMGGEPENAAEVRRLIASLEETIAREKATPSLPSPTPTVETKEAPAVEPVPQARPAPSSVNVAAPPIAERVRPPARRTKIIAGVTVAAVGVAAIVVGATFEGLAKQASDQLTNLDRTGGQYDPTKFAHGKSYDAAGMALLAVGGVAAVVGAIVAIVGARERKQSRAGVTSSLRTLQVRF